MTDEINETNETNESPYQFSIKRGALPFVAPLAAFLILSWLESSMTEQASYPLAYSIKLLGTAVVAAICWSAIPRWASRGVWLGVIFGLLSCPVWIGLDWVQREAVQLPGMNFLASEREGYAPELNALSAGAAAFLAVRLLGLIVVVPLIEEVFWRGFLARFMIDEKFEQVRPGKMTVLSFAITTLAFAAVHPEVLAAVVWGAGINLVWIKTGNLWACIVAHAVTNAALGGYILATGAWHLW